MAEDMGLEPTGATVARAFGERSSRARGKATERGAAARRRGRGPSA